MGTVAARLVALTWALTMFAAACSAGGDDADRSTCALLGSLSDAIDRVSAATSTPEPGSLEDDLSLILDHVSTLSDRGVDAVALEEVRISALEFRRTAEVYDYDLLTAQTAGSTEEQERLYVFDARATQDARVVLAQARTAQCVDG